MKTIPLSKGYEAIVDDEDYDRVSQFKWSVVDASHGYAFKPCASRRIRGTKNSHQKLHRFIMEPPTGMEIDHIDGNCLNNQKSNLRICTHAENCRNARIHNKHGLKGVAFVLLKSGNKKWMAKITHAGKMRTIGYFHTAIDAARAYNEQAIKLFGEFAKLNIIHR